MDILENQTLEMFNVLSFRGKYTQQELEEKTKKMEAIIRQAGVSKAGPSVSTTYSVEMGSNAPILDVEVLIPLSTMIKVPEGFTVKEHFLLQNAIKTVHRGSLALLENTILKVNQYIENHRLIPVTALYTVSRQDISGNLNTDEVEVDVYVGVSENINYL